MYRIAFLVVAGISLSVQAQINENFEDGNFTDNPSWKGDTADFLVVDQHLQSSSNIENYEFELLCDNAQAPEEILFDVELNFKTSSANYIDLILYRGSTLEYFVRLGGVKDGITLYARAILDSIILQGPEGLSENARFSIRIVQLDSQKHLLQYKLNGNLKFNDIGTFNLYSHESHQLGWRIRQSTSSFYNKHNLYSLYAGKKIVDSIPPMVDSIQPLSEKSLSIHFNEDIVLNNMSLISMDMHELDTLLLNKNHLLLTFNSNISFTEHVIRLQGIQDSSGNTLQDTSIRFLFYIPSAPDRHDLIINEILFNPIANGVDYIELYNKSDKYVDLSKCSLLRWRNMAQESVHSICSEKTILQPKSYVVCTLDTTLMCNDYNCYSSGVKLQCFLPPMNNDEGIIVLSYDDKTVDSLSYSEDWHLSLLPSVDGVSLERILFNEATNSSHNWHSASETVGYGTPGYKNSQSIEQIWTSSLNLQYNSISPNGDAYQDFLLLNYSFLSVNNVLSAFVYSLDGTLIQQIANTLFLNTEGSYSWDLVLNNGTLLQDAKYILYIEVFNTQGKVLRKKLPFSVVSH